MAPTDEELDRWEGEGGSPHPQEKDEEPDMMYTECTSKSKWECTGESECEGCTCVP